MCEHCGCRGVEPIAELMDEHLALLDLADNVLRQLAAGDRAAAAVTVNVLAGLLDRHVGREERGIFTALRDQGDFVEEVEALEEEHVTFDRALAGLDPAASDFDARVVALLHDLDEHVERENLGIFPVSVVTLGARGWETVGRAHSETPTFLADPDASSIPAD
ncbi:MAG: hemerythrin domain-containing protein [Mycobacteriaceae bacterium]